MAHCGLAAPHSRCPYSSGAQLLSSQRLQGMTVAADVCLTCRCVTVQSVLSVTFNDGPDPDAPAATDLWNNGLQGMAEAEPQREVMPANKPVNSPYSDYKYSTGGYQVQRLERWGSPPPLTLLDGDTAPSKIPNPKPHVARGPEIPHH